MYEQEPVKKVALIGLGAIGSFLASHLQTVLGDNLRIIAGGGRKGRLEREGGVVNGEQLHFHLGDPAESCGGDYPQAAIIIKVFRACPGAERYQKSDRPPHHYYGAPQRGGERGDCGRRVWVGESIVFPNPGQRGDEGGEGYI